MPSIVKNLGHKCKLGKVQMNLKNTKHFFDRYPEMFPKNRSIRESLLCFGLMCGDGWFDLIDSLCNYTYKMCKNNDWKVPEVVEVKEKYGTLRFYTLGIDGNAFDTIEGAIRFAEFQSGTICEDCGRKGKLRSNIPWWRTLCDPCLAKWKKEKKIK